MALYPSWWLLISERNFDAQLIHGILNNTDIQDTLIQNVLEVLGDKGYYGVNLDLKESA